MDLVEFLNKFILLKNKKQFFIIFFILNYTVSFCQKQILIDSVAHVNSTVSFQDLLNYKYKLNKKGYAFSSLDSVYETKDSTTSWVVHRNKKIEKLLLYIKQNKLDSNYGTVIECSNLKGINSKLADILNKKIQMGYLKASYVLDTFYLTDKEFKIFYSYQENYKYKIDSIRIFNSSSTINTHFLKNILRLDDKDLNGYDFKETMDYIKYIDFIEFEKNPDFSIQDSIAILNLYLKERKLNQVNAILGILSNAYQTDKVQLTGDVNLSLNNILNRGISLAINWQKNLENSQFLFLKTSIPFVLKTKFGVNFNFNLEKFDTSYLRLSNQVGIEYFINPYQSISFIYRNQISNIDGIDAQKISKSILPNYLDYSFNQFGIGYKLNKLNRPFFVKYGWKIDAAFLLGNKNNTINSKIADVKDAQGNSMKRLYDSFNLSQSIASFQLSITRYSPISSYIVLKSFIESKGLFADNIRFNEMYYIGGNKLPRGFDDNSIISPNYITLSNEFQYYLSDYFYSNIFADISFIQNSLNKNDFQFPMGFGFGLSLKTSGNIFQLSIGSGLLGDRSLSLTNSKVHINYTNVF